MVSPDPASPAPAAALILINPASLAEPPALQIRSAPAALTLTSDPPETEASATTSSIDREIVNSKRPRNAKAVESVVVVKLRLPAATRCKVCAGRLTVTILNPPPVLAKLPVVVLASSVWMFLETAAVLNSRTNDAVSANPGTRFVL